MAYSFFVVMLDTVRNGVVYPDMNKVSNNMLYLFKEDAEQAHKNLPEDIRGAFHVVELIAMSKAEYASDDAPDLLSPPVDAGLGGCRLGDQNPPLAEDVISSQCSSFWLKRVLKSALARDPVDAARDAAILSAVLANRC